MEADKIRNVKQTLNKSKSQNEPQQQKANSIFIARQLIKGDRSQYGKRLFDFKNKKNQNYDKFSEHIFDNLKQSTLTFENSLQILKDISHQASQQNTTGHQMSSILEGFQRFWRKCKISLNQMQNCFDFITEVYCHLAKKYISICRELIAKKLEEQFQNFREQALKLVNKYYRGSKVEQDKILPLVHQFDLFSAFENVRVVQIAMRYSNANDIAFIFKTNQQKIDYDLVKLFIDKCVSCQSKQDLKRCETIIKILKLDPYDYKNMIQKMIGRYINYQLRTFKLYFIELVVKYDIQLVEALVLQLLKQNKERQAKYFIIKYALQNHYFYDQIDNKQKENLLKIKNILEDNDHFAPTEIDVLQQKFPQQKSTLYMKHFGLEESNVFFVDKSNISQINIQRQFSNKIGMDTETTGGVHVFDEPQMTLIQIFNGRHVYIFDYINLVGNKHLHNIIKHIFTHCKVYGHDHQKQITSIQKELNLDIQEKVMQELQRNRILDTSKHFKKVFPKEAKSNLVYLTEYLLNLTLSKYEQCSGWRNRPLRKAQLHYASLDCIMPLVLGEKLEQIQKSQKK